MELGPRKIIEIGQFYITETVVLLWIISAILILFAFLSTRNMQKIPKGLQAVAEWIVDFIYRFVAQTMGSYNMRFAPYMGTLLLVLVVGNVLAIFGFRPISANVNTTFALASITFFMIHYNAVKERGVIGYLKHLSEPSVLMLPVNIISELAFPLSIAFRLFGNITGGVIIMSLLYGGLASLSAKLTGAVPVFMIGIPLPFNFFFDIFEGILQAYIFTTLSMVFVSNGIGHQEK